MHTTILGCGIFGSVSGSSAATCATISKVALPELLQRGYDEKIALGSLATAGTLGILIPPSITMVVYAVAAEASIMRIFLAGFIPGFLLMALFSGYIAWWAWRHPERIAAAGAADDASSEKLRRSGQLIPVRAADRVHRGRARAWAGRRRPSARRTACSARWCWPGAGGSLNRRIVRRQPDGRDARVLHDHVHPRRRQVPVDDDGLHGHSARARRVGRRARALAVRADRRAVRGLHRARHCARRHLDDRADRRRSCCR